ncbi:hypothetical protein AOT96_28545 [Rhodococcus sp. 008]|nr:hypothetical protein AOT96_28545 [Rhodococcus sp. 008]
MWALLRNVIDVRTDSLVVDVAILSEEVVRCHFSKPEVFRVGEDSRCDSFDFVATEGFDLSVQGAELILGGFGAFAEVFVLGAELADVREVGAAFFTFDLVVRRLCDWWIG